MRTLRLSLMGTVTLALLGGLSGAALAQDEVGTDLFTPVTGQRLTASIDDSADESWEAGGVLYISGLVGRETYEWSDPRLPADAVQNLSMGRFTTGADYPGVALSGSLALEGLDGYWTGQWRGYYDEGSVGHISVVLTGQGAYEDLSAILGGTLESPECIECLTFEGGIFNGELPPLPDLPPMPG